MTREERAENILRDAYDMYPQKHKPSEYAKKPFPMYSYERVAGIFWNGVILGLIDNGLNEEEIESKLRSKDMRHMLDANEEKIEELAKSIIKSIL